MVKTQSVLPSLFLCVLLAKSFKSVLGQIFWNYDSERMLGDEWRNSAHVCAQRLKSANGFFVRQFIYRERFAGALQCSAQTV